VIESGKLHFKRKAVRIVGEIALEPGAAAAPLYLRVMSRVRELIMQGALPPGAKLPSTRALAESLGISRNSVLAAIDQLNADGWLDIRRGSGAYVAARTPVDCTPAPSKSPPARAPRGARPFEVGLPALDLFPIQVWNRLSSRQWRSMPQTAFYESEGGGTSELRAAIASHLATSRGFACSPEQIIITLGARASIDLAVRLLGLSGETAIVEEPCYFGAKDILRQNGMRLLPVAVDGDGMHLEGVGTAAEHARLAIVSPACQFPLSVEMTQDRREALLAWASRGEERTILEDNFDCESSGGRAVASLATASDRVIFLNSFNKLLFPSLRVGYMVVPHRLVDRFDRFRTVVEAHVSVPTQLLLAEFINAGYMDQHLKRLRVAYIERRAVLRSMANDRLGEHLTVDESTSGSHLIATLRHLTEAEAVRRADRAGLALTPMSLFSEFPSEAQRVLLGFANVSPSRIRSAVEVLRRALSDDRP